MGQLHDPSVAGSYFLWLGFAYSFLGERALAVQSLQRACTEGSRCNDAVIIGRAHAWLALEMQFAGHLQQSITHGEHAVAFLESTGQLFWLGTAMFMLGISYAVSGDFHRAIHVAERLQTMSKTGGDSRLQVNALQLIGWCHTELGAWEAGIEALQYAISVSPDAFETAWTIGLLGNAYLAKGDLPEALRALEQAVQEAGLYRSRQVQSLFKTFLGEAYHAVERPEKGWQCVQQGFELAQDIKFPWGIGLAQRTLGRIAHTRGDLAAAATYVQQALATFDVMQARYELARTHLDLASLAHTQDDQDAATTHLSTAYAWFKKLQVPQWIEQTEQLAREYGMTLTAVALEELTEEPS